MDLSAVEQAGVRLHKAERALERLTKATGFAEAEDAWSDFLLAASGMYSKLQQGAKVSGKSGEWFGRQVKARRDNAVLRYIHHARNSDEHGIRRITGRSGPNWWEGRELQFGEQIQVEGQFADGRTLEPKGDPVKAWIFGPYITLVRVHDDRYHDYCDPPAVGTIEGKIGTNPIHVAEAAIPMLRTMLEEAAELV